ncbi:MAG: hypothetical protein HYZ49_13690 [Chloroflexi bacterium]|nr:hypothetical protein [Chloroflexota bacterium]
MKDVTVSEILSQHVEALNAGRIAEAERLAAGPGREELAGLFNMAGRLKTAMKPVTPRAEFVANLKQRLIRESQAGHQKIERRQQLAWAAVGVGGLVYSISLFVMGIRATWWMLGVVALLLGWRKRPALVKAPQAVRR